MTDKIRKPIKHFHWKKCDHKTNELAMTMRFLNVFNFFIRLWLTLNTN